MALTYGTVTGRFEDTTSGITEPITGTVYFTAEADYLLTSDSTVLPAPVAVELVNSAFTVELVATDDPTLTPVDWTYRVSFNLKVNGYPLKREAFSIKVPTGAVTDLAVAAPVASSEGVAIVRGPQGEQGIQGFTGPQGLQGIQGVKGDTGPAGPGTEVIFQGAGEGQSVSGSVITQSLGWAIWTMSAAGSDQLAFPFHIPAWWQTFNVDLLWVNYVGGTVGDVVFRHDMEQVNVGGPLTSFAGVQQTVTVEGQYVVASTRMAAGMQRTSDFIRVKPTRLGSLSADTYGNTIGVIGVRLSRVT